MTTTPALRGQVQGEPITIGMAAHYVFCPRRAWLEANGEATDTQQLAIGLDAHRKTDDPSRSSGPRTRAVDGSMRSGDTAADVTPSYETMAMLSKSSSTSRRRCGVGPN